MNLFQYRKGVRELLRDDGYPESDIDSAINRVIKDINSLGRFRFHEQEYNFNLTLNTYTYAAPATVLAERLLIYASGNNTYQKEVPRRRELWTGSILVPTTQGDSPSEWFRYNNNWYIEPIPSATMLVNGNMTMLYDKDLVALLSPADTNAFPDRHSNVIIYGTVAQLRPGILIGSPEGQVTIESLYAKSTEFMRQQEQWNYASIPTLRVGQRFSTCSNWGHSSRIRG